jgi:hypothetical protein
MPWFEMNAGCIDTRVGNIGHDNYTNVDKSKGEVVPVLN